MDAEAESRRAYFNYLRTGNPRYLQASAHLHTWSDGD